MLLLHHGLKNHTVQFSYYTHMYARYSNFQLTVTQTILKLFNDVNISLVLLAQRVAHFCFQDSNPETRP